MGQLLPREDTFLWKDMQGKSYSIGWEWGVCITSPAPSEAVRPEWKLILAGLKKVMLILNLKKKKKSD